LFSGLRVRVRPNKIREPDLAFIAKQNYTRRSNRYWSGADLVMEIVSSDSASRDRDYQQKVVDYVEAGIPEYWIVDPERSEIAVMTLKTGADSYVQHSVSRLGDSASSIVLPGFAVDVTAVFAAAKK
jgi:Uma2 family endonuclease